MEWLFSWEVTSWVVSGAVAAALAFIALDDFRLAKLFFLIAAGDALGGMAMWGIKSDAPAWFRNVVVFLVIGGIGVLFVQTLRYVDSKRYAKETPPHAPVQPTPIPAPTPSPTMQKLPSKPVVSPHLEIGLVLGADKGIGTDAIVDCAKPIYTCLSEAELKNAHLTFDVGTKGWARLIIRIKNVGSSELLKSVTHIESPSPISIDYAPRPDSSRLPRNVLDIYEGHPIYPFGISRAESAIPLDIVVPAGVDEFDINVNIFGDNMASEKRTLHFDVKR